MTFYLASTYNSGAYGASTYATSTQHSKGGSGSTHTGAGSTQTGGSSPTGNVLTSTGFDIALAVTVAAVIMFSAAVVRFWKRPAPTDNQ